MTKNDETLKMCEVGVRCEKQDSPETYKQSDGETKTAKHSVGLQAASCCIELEYAMSILIDFWREYQ